MASERMYASPAKSAAVVVEESPEILVIGGGIIGLATAYVLAERGLRVEVLEASGRDEDTVGATLAAAGMVSPLTETQPDSDLGPICRTARDLWPSWAEWLAGESNTDLAFAKQGTLIPAFGSAELQHADSVQQQAESQAEDWERWGPEQVSEAIPALAPGVLSAVFLPNEYSVDPKAVAKALRLLLARRGVLVHRGRAVERITEVAGGLNVAGSGWSVSCPYVVLAAGAGCAQIECFGSLPVRPIKGEMIAFNAPSPPVGPNVRTIDHYALCRRGELLVGATEEDVGFEQSTTSGGRTALRNTALQLFPSLRWKAVSRHWAGLRPATSDGLPYLGFHQSERVVAATGHYRNGILLAPWTARVVADLLAHGSSVDLPDSFSPQRVAESLAAE